MSALRRYTVIGASGFIGARAVEMLRTAGEDVFAPRRDDDLDGADLGRVFYCAGLTGDYRSRPFDAVEAHVGRLSRILEHGRFERLVYLSSTRVYDANPEAGGREDAPLRVNPNDPEHLYELTKLLGENLAVNRSGGRGAAARLSYVFDWTPDAAGFLSDWLKQAAATRKLTIASSGAAGRDYIHRDDAVDALRTILDGGESEVINVASGQILTNLALATVFEDAGWAVTFNQADGAPAAGAPDIGRLAALGVKVRDVRTLIAAHLRELTP